MAHPGSCVLGKGFLFRNKSDRRIKLRMCGTMSPLSPQTFIERTEKNYISEYSNKSFIIVWVSQVFSAKSEEFMCHQG